MQDDLARLHLVGEVDGALAVAHPLVALAGIGRRAGVEVGRGVRDAGGQRAEVVAGGDLDDPLLDRLEDARHQRDPDAVAQLDILEAQGRHLLEHRITVLMTVRAPAGGKGDDRLHAGGFH